ncbi:MAG: class I SAM-dependent methyltransferase [Lachnospiraceae bacterium]|nr:class I SAM-dependent methyltransferase [Lachnospiraceae bacterium]
MKKRVVIFGAGGTGQRVYNSIKNEMDVVFFVDNDEKKWGSDYDGVEIRSPKELFNDSQYDVIEMGTLMGLNEIQEQLMREGISLSKLDKAYAETSVNARIFFLKRLSERFAKNGITGAVAEAGVFRGEFAKEINKYFPDSRCYLFDTFEGFDERDFSYEEKDSMIVDVNHFTMTSEESVYEKMPNKDKVVIKKGYFPESLGDLEDEFIFVNLDMDLYKPTLEGLKYFYPRMKEGGVILIHDYFTEAYPNIEKSLDDYEAELGQRLHKMPIGDDISIAIIK